MLKNVVTRDAVDNIKQLTIILFFEIFLAKRRPFMIFFRTNGNEAEDSGGLAAQTGLTNEQEDYPGGIIGFSLDFKQSISC